MKTVSKEWIDYVRDNVIADFEKGFIFWSKPLKGRNMNKPIGGSDSKGYIKVQIHHVSTYAHRIIWLLATGEMPDLLDHINQVPYDNRLINLRKTTYSENALNSVIWNTNTTGVKGVSKTPFNNFKVTKCGQHLGTFKTIKEAADAYNRYK